MLWSARTRLARRSVSEIAVHGATVDPERVLSPLMRHPIFAINLSPSESSNPVAN